jgi:hypothetical protein
MVDHPYLAGNKTDEWAGDTKLLAVLWDNRTALVSKGIAYDMRPSDGLVTMSSTGPLTINLPMIAEIAPGMQYEVTMGNTGTVTVATPGAELINALNTFILNARWQNAIFRFDGINWQARAAVKPQQLDGWTMDNAAANQTAVLMTRVPSSTWYAMRSGSITGVSLAIEATADQQTAGTATVQVYKNGVAVSAMTAIIDGTNRQYKATLQAPQVTGFVAGDKLDLRLSTSSTWAPVTADFRATLEIEA